MKKIYLFFLLGLFSTSLIILSLFYPQVVVVIILLYLIIYLMQKYKKDFIQYLGIFLITMIVAFNFLNVGYLLLTLLVIIFILDNVIKGNFHINKTYTNYYYFFILWILIIVTQLFFIELEENTKSHIVGFLFGVIIIWLMKNIITTPDKLRTTYLYWGIAILITIIIAYFEILTGNTFSNQTAYPHKNVATVGFYNQNNYSFLIAISLPIYFFWMKGNPLLKALSIFSIGSIIFVLYINNTRSIMILAVLIIIYMLIKSMMNKYRMVTIFIFSSLLIALLLNVEIFESYSENILSISAESDSSVNSRKHLLTKGLEIFYQNPIIGVGPGNTDYFMPVEGYKIHSFWIETLANYGIIIFIGLLLLFMTFLYTYVFSVSRHIKYLIEPLFIAVIIFIPASFTPSSIFKFQILWFLIGLMLCSLNIINKDKYNAPIINKVGLK